MQSDRPTTRAALRRQTMAVESVINPAADNVALKRSRRTASSLKITEINETKEEISKEESSTIINVVKKRGRKGNRSSMMVSNNSITDVPIIELKEKKNRKKIETIIVEKEEKEKEKLIHIKEELIKQGENKVLDEAPLVIKKTNIRPLLASNTNNNTTTTNNNNNGGGVFTALDKLTFQFHGPRAPTTNSCTSRSSLSFLDNGCLLSSPSSPQLESLLKNNAHYQQLSTQEEKNKIERDIIINELLNRIKSPKKEGETMIVSNKLIEEKSINKQSEEQIKIIPSIKENTNNNNNQGINRNNTNDHSMIKYWMIAVFVISVLLIFFNYFETISLVCQTTYNQSYPSMQQFINNGMKKMYESIHEIRSLTVSTKAVDSDQSVMCDNQSGMMGCLNHN